MPRVYLDTSFVSACVTDRQDASSVYRRDVSREWFAHHRENFECVISAAVIAQLSSPVFARRNDALALVEPLPLLEIDAQVIGIASIFARELVMPGPILSGDAAHVALCCAYRVEYLLSWNIRHLANPNKIRHLQVICQRLGLVPPAIMTPDALWDF